MAAALAHARTGRRYRAAIVGGSAADLAAEARAHAAPDPARQPVDHPPRVGFLFSGQGSQYPSMGAELDRHQPVFRRAIDRCASVLDARLAHPLRELLFDPSAAALLRETQFTQPALVALQYALVELWRSWGVEPVAVAGHSVGEYAAACVAGVLSVEDALVMVAERGRLMGERCPRGAMVAVSVSEERLRAAIAARGAAGAVAVAAVNAPLQVVLSGDEGVVSAIAAELEAEGAPVHRLEVSHAFHSPHMDAVMQPFAAVPSR